MSIKSESILALDDDVRTLDRIHAILDSTYIVLATTDNKRASIWLQTDKTIGAVVVAQNLKGGGALKLLQAAQKLRPAARRILIASYTDIALFMEGIHSGAIQRTISKPIDPHELMGLIRIAPAATKPRATPQTVVV